MRSGLPEAWCRRWRSMTAGPMTSARALTISVDDTAWRPQHETFRFRLDSGRVRIEAAGSVAWFRGDDAPAIGRSARAFLAQIRHDAPDGAPPLCAVGGRAFDGGGVAGPWEALAGASLVVPRVLVRRGASSWATLYVREGETVEAACRDALGAVADEAVRLGVPAVQRDRRSAFEAAVRAAVERIHQGRAAKVVLSRRTRLGGRFSADAVAARLVRPDAGSARFAVGFGARTFLGATPELLVRRAGGRVETDALAGSAPPEEEDALLQSAKDREEHQRVVEHVAAVASGVGATARHPATPSLRSLGYVTHLWTPIELEDRADLDAWQWGAALHPTPAVGGWPPDAALSIIRELEPHARGWYCGAVGWLDATGDGELFVALRSALVEPDSATLFVGVGVVGSSDPTREWRETQWKERAMLSAFGVEDAVSADSR